jgi:hypothetical protein
MFMRARFLPLKAGCRKMQQHHFRWQDGRLPGIPHARKYKYVDRDKTIVRPEWACITLAESGRFTHSQNR